MDSAVAFTIINPAYHAETNPDVPQNIVNPAYPIYEGGDIRSFRNITGIYWKSILWISINRSYQKVFFK